MTDEKPMDCTGAGDDLGAYLDGELAADRQEAVHRHLQECSACHNEFVALRAVAGAIRALPLPDPSPGMREDLLAKVTADAGRSSRWFGQVDAGPDHVRLRRQTPVRVRPTTSDPTAPAMGGTFRMTLLRHEGGVTSQMEWSE